MKTISLTTLVLMSQCLAAVSFTARAADETVDLYFQAHVGDVQFACGQSYEKIGAAVSTVTPGDFRFYVYDVALIDDRGRVVPIALEQDGRWQYRNVALLDFEDGTGACRNGNAGTHEAISGKVPAGQYRGVQFTLGLPFDLNHADATLAPSPLNFTAMFWNWQGGYRFLKIDMSSGNQSGSAGFPVHIGSTGCATALGSPKEAPVAPCRQPNTMTVRFDRFDVTSQVVVADLRALLEDVNVELNMPKSAPGCMSGTDDSDCVAVMRNLGLSFGDQAAIPQRFFRVEPR